MISEEEQKLINLPKFTYHYKRNLSTIYKLRVDVLLTWYHEYDLFLGSIDITISLALGIKLNALNGVFKESK